MNATEDRMGEYTGELLGMIERLKRQCDEYEREHARAHWWLIFHRWAVAIAVVATLGNIASMAWLWW